MNASREMPKYVCHKKVWALKIAEITEPTDATGTSRTIIPADEGYGPFVVDGAYMEKHKPEVGGYYVVYEDGYKSFSPAGAFESGYTPLLLEQWNNRVPSEVQPPVQKENRKWMRSTKEWLLILLLTRRSVLDRHGNEPLRLKNDPACSGSPVYSVMATSGAHCLVKISKMALSVLAIVLTRPCGHLTKLGAKNCHPHPTRSPRRACLKAGS